MNPPTKQGIDRFSLAIGSACILTTICCGIYLLSVETSRRHALSGTGQKEEPTRLRVYPELSVQAILDAYEANEVRADARFKGQTFVISGAIESIGKDVLGRPFLILTKDGSPQYPAIQASFSTEHLNALAQLDKRYSVRITCTGSGKLMHIQFSNCRF